LGKVQNWSLFDLLIVSALCENCPVKAEIFIIFTDVVFTLFIVCAFRMGLKQCRSQKTTAKIGFEINKFIV